MTSSAQKEPSVLFVDDEIKALKVFEKAFRNQFSVFTAPSTAEAMEVLKEHSDEIGVVIADQKMPGGSGIDFLHEVRERFPDKIRLLTTAYTEIETLVGAINEGSVFRFISKPWNLQSLGEEIAEARQSYHLSARDREFINRRLEELKDAVLDEKVAEVGTVAISLSHYVDNALCPFDLLISKISENLSKETDESYLSFLKRIREHIRATSENISHLRLVDAPLETERLESVDLSELLDRCLTRNRELCEGKNITFSVERGSDPYTVTGDPERLADFFHFMIAEEVVSLNRDSCISIQLQKSSEAGVEIKISDNQPLRPGVSPDDFLYPFNVRSANPRNFGVFLICAYFHVRAHGGTMKVRQKENGGLTFCFFFSTHPSLPSSE
tara:strand:- start:21430 stop:22581 length:1152 start_codon:yes stop_codon:yes gene_type:complete